LQIDIAHVPLLQKRIIRSCNEHCVPVITATQMLDSMQRAEIPTRAEASDVANAVLDGSDALMLSGETAIGVNPAQAVTVMSRIAAEAERLVRPWSGDGFPDFSALRAKIVTQAVTRGAGTIAEQLSADLIVVVTRSGRSALALSNQRRQTPILGLCDTAETARRMCLYWGVTPVETAASGEPIERLLQFVVDWGRRTGSLQSASRYVLIHSTDKGSDAKDALIVRTIP
jgi:pyruvate kinase